MGEARRTKTCRLCYMEIDARAEKCPYCQQWQHRLALTTVRPAIPSLIGLAVMVAVLGFAAYTGRRLWWSGEDFANHAGELTVTGSRMDFWNVNGGLRAMVVGKLRNKGSVPWKYIELECQFYDAEGKLVDVGHESHSGTVLSHGEAAFSVGFDADLPREAYVGHQVIVRAARDARSGW